jgi:hypothetical protein
MAHRQVRIQSDGHGGSTTVTLEDGTQIPAASAVIWLDAGEINRAEVTFLGPGLDVHAELKETIMKCPVCDHESTHYCPEGAGL